MVQFFTHVTDDVGEGPLSFERLHSWSVRNPGRFWSLCWDFVGVIGEKGTTVNDSMNEMMNAKFFPTGFVNFAENCLRGTGEGAALIFSQENACTRTISWRELRQLVLSLARALRAQGLLPGDRVCAVAANVAETVIAMLAATSLGAIWSSVSPDFGVEGILERFSQIEPKVLFFTEKYCNKNRTYDLSDRIRQVEKALSQDRPLISIPLTPEGLKEFCECHPGDTAAPFEFAKCSFNDPVFIMFSSGTTGKPKCIVHRQGVILQLMKEHQLHCDIKSGDRVFYYSTTTWMMWNWLVGALASEATILLYEGNPFYPDCNALFEFAGTNRATFFGVSAKLIDSLRFDPAFVTPALFDTVRTIASTGSPLVPESFDFVYTRIKSDVNLASICGGTDILSCFILGTMLKPVKRGFSQCRGLGMDVQIWDPTTGKPVVGKKGELVCCTPFPSQPIGFWNDTPDRSAYRNAYFSEWPNVWKHGDFCLIDSEGHVKVFGRSDATLKPGGVRIGTAEIYRAVESLEFVKESLCCGIEFKPGDESVALFVVLVDPSQTLTDDMRHLIREAVKKSTTRHHVPTLIEQVSDIPRTKSGKIVELAVKSVLHGQEVRNLNALANPEILKEFAKFSLRH